MAERTAEHRKGIISKSWEFIDRHKVPLAFGALALWLWPEHKILAAISGVGAIATVDK